MPPQSIPWLLGALGAFVGSFLNVCILRMPAGRSIVFPGSACPACGKPIPAWHNVPVLSFFILRGRCASCGAAISSRYPFVEALTAALFVAAWFEFGPTLALAEALVLLSALIVLFFTDLDERILPDLVTLPVTGLGLAFSIFRPGWPFASPEAGASSIRSLLLSLATALGGAGSFWLLGRLWRLVRPEIDTAIGLGDVKLMAMIGAFLGPALTLMTVLAGSLLGSLLYLFVRVLAFALPPSAAAAPPPLRPLMRGLEAAGFVVEGRSAGMVDQIPFGSLLAVGAAISLFFGRGLLDVYLAVAGFPVS